MSEEQSKHPLYSNDKPSKHPLNDAAIEPEKPKKQGIPIPLLAETPFVTYALIIINVAIFVIRYLSPELGEAVLLWGYGSSELILEHGEFYRLFTMMFLHFNEVHILFNAIALYYIGSNIERLFGHVRYLLIYILGGLAGSIVPLFISNSGGLGASGAVFAIWGAEAVFLYHHRQIFGAAGRARLQNSLMLMLVNFLAGFSANALATVADSGVRIGNSAHFGGLIGGAILTYFIGTRLQVRRKTDVEEGEIPIEIVYTNRLIDNIPYLLYFCCGLLALLLIAFFLHT